ncbi:unnamed protein product, partial [Rotaria sp. Silwood1]
LSAPTTRNNDVHGVSVTIQTNILPSCN